MALLAQVALVLVVLAGVERAEAFRCSSLGSYDVTQDCSPSVGPTTLGGGLGLQTLGLCQCNWHNTLNTDLGILNLVYKNLQQSGSVLPNEATLNFTGSGVTCADDSVNGRTNCSISGGGSSFPTGPAGGDLSGMYPNPTVSKINGVAYNADPLTQYVAIGGRSGSGNNFVISKDCGSVGCANIIGSNALGTLEIDTNATFNGKLTVGATQLLLISPGSSVQLYLNAADGHNFALAPPATMTSSTVYIWPSGPPSSSGQVLSSTTLGVMSWATAVTGSGTTVAGQIPLFTNTTAGAISGNTSGNALLQVGTATSGSSLQTDTHVTSVVTGRGIGLNLYNGATLASGQEFDEVVIGATPGTEVTNIVTLPDHAIRARFGIMDLRTFQQATGIGGTTGSTISNPDMMGSVFYAAPTFKSATGSVFNMTTMDIFTDAVSYAANGGNINHGDRHYSFRSNPNFGGAPNWFGGVLPYHAFDVSPAGLDSSVQVTGLSLNYLSGAAFFKGIISNINNTEASNVFIGHSGTAPSFHTGKLRLGDSTAPTYQLDVVGDFRLNGAPRFAGNSATCGTGCSSVNGNDRVGQINVAGGGSAITSVTMNFSTTLSSQPICQLTTDSFTAPSTVLNINSISTTQLIVNSSQDLRNDRIWYHCYEVI